MYNARIFYNVQNGDVLSFQTMNGGEPLSIENEAVIVSKTRGISVENINCMEWDNPENELETIISNNKVVKVDVSQTPPVIYGEEPEIIEPSDDDEIGGQEFLNMVEGVL